LLHSEVPSKAIKDFMEVVSPLKVSPQVFHSLKAVHPAQWDTLALHRGWLLEWSEVRILMISLLFNMRIMRIGNVVVKLSAPPILPLLPLLMKLLGFIARNMGNMILLSSSVH
jgi:hypothetical protein